MIITNDELADVIAEAERTNWRRCDLEHCYTCKQYNPYEQLTKEDLVADLIEARAQIKVLESNQCAC